MYFKKKYKFSSINMSNKNKHMYHRKYAFILPFKRCIQCLITLVSQGGEQVTLQQITS